MPEQIVVVDPATEQVVAELEAATPSAVDAAVERALSAWAEWRWMPASTASDASRMAVSGVSSAGFSTTVLPAASAGASFHDSSSSG